MKNNRIRLVRLLSLLVMLALLGTHAMAAGALTLTVTPTVSGSGKTRAGETICLCYVAKLEQGYTLTEPFAESHLSVSALTGESANDYAGQIVDYVKAHSVPVVARTTDRSGSAVFAGLEPGIYLLYPKTTGSFAPFLILLNGKDENCEPKLEEPDPGPKPPDPIKPKPPYTGDDSRAALYTVGVLVGLAGLSLCAFLPLRGTKKDDPKKKNKDKK